MLRFFSTAFCAACLPAFGFAISLPEAEVTKEIARGAPTSEEMRIYADDGTHIIATLRRTPVTVTYTMTTGFGLQYGDMDQLRTDALICADGLIENASEGEVGDLVIFRYDCVTRR